MDSQAIRQLQMNLGVPVTGVLDSATSAAMNGAVAKALAGNSTIASYAGTNDPNAIVNAYMTNDWSGVTSLSGVPFTPDQQQAAVRASEKALSPAYDAGLAYDTATTEDTLRNNAEGLADTRQSNARQFTKDKNALDQSAADSGVLFSGSRLQKQNDLRTTYETADQRAARDAAESAASTARGYQYTYGNDNAPKLSEYYTQPGAQTYNAGVAHGAVTASPALSTVYSPGAYDFQGTKPVAQKTAVQTRAAGLLANRANKLSLSGIGSKL